MVNAESLDWSACEKLIILRNLLSKEAENKLILNPISRGRFGIELCKPENDREILELAKVTNIRKTEINYYMCEHINNFGGPISQHNLRIIFDELINNYKPEYHFYYCVIFDTICCKSIVDKFISLGYSQKTLANFESVDNEHSPNCFSNMKMLLEAVKKYFTLSIEKHFESLDDKMIAKVIKLREKIKNYRDRAIERKRLSNAVAEANSSEIIPNLRNKKRYWKIKIVLKQLMTLMKLNQL